MSEQYKAQRRIADLEDTLEQFLDERYDQCECTRDDQCPWCAAKLALGRLPGMRKDRE